MGTIKQNQDLATTWIIDTSNDSYSLGKNAEIKTDGEAAIDVALGANNNDIILRGDAIAENTNAVVKIAGSGTHLAIAEGGSVQGSSSGIGVLSSGANFSMANAGYISGKSYAVSAANYSDIDNSGIVVSNQVGIAGDDGLDLLNSGSINAATFGVLANADGTVIRNLEGAQIVSEGAAIALSGEGTAVIRNAGLLKGQQVVSDGAGDTTVINTGKMLGNAHLGAGDDVFNTRNGKFDGLVNGGDGDDLYIISKSNTQIEEQPAFGYDTVKSTVSFTLGDYLEDLKLLGAKDANATGNEANNVLTGNRGDNIVSGMGGNDYLIGGKGDDTLLGGAGQDLFDFRKGTGDDVVEDFVNGEDVIFTPFANNGPEIADLIANHAVEKNGGVMIAYGDDSLFLKGMTMEQLDESDFFSGL